jgi:hypothetical protein
MTQVNAYSIFDIEAWQLELQEQQGGEKSGSSEVITLPTLQRGFVWKPYQIEMLWDSILRGYPIGSLLISPSEGRKDLLDGQQRCTSIAIGFKDPFENSEAPQVLNLKIENVPAIWIDLQPMDKNIFGLKYGVRVLTRSHPWGYQLYNHRKPLSVYERGRALQYFRMKSEDPTLNFSEIKYCDRSPWDAKYPIPLSILLTANGDSKENWIKEVRSYIRLNLSDISTKDKERVDYEDVFVNQLLEDQYVAINNAKRLLVPEISVDKELFLEEEKNDNETDATIFLRLNSSGTQIGGQELIYSLLKAILPESKELVEQIGLKYIAPIRVVNLIARFVIMEISDFAYYHKELQLNDFRIQLKKENNFKEKLKEIILTENAKKLIDRAIEIITSHKEELPKTFYRDLISGNTDLLLVFLVYIKKGNQSDEDEAAIRRSFLHSYLFSKKRNFIAEQMFKQLKERQFKDWGLVFDQVVNDNTDDILPLINATTFKDFLINHVMPAFLSKRNGKFDDDELLGELFRKNEEIRQQFVFKITDDLEYTPEEKLTMEVSEANKSWQRLTKYLFWDKSFLMVSQRDYLNREFGAYMAFEGIEDMSRPWDWDHIYPVSWVYKKRYRSEIVKLLINTTGNFRALSFNDNRSENNNLSPFDRFSNKIDVQGNSFIKKDDLEHWLELSFSDSKLIETPGQINEKIDHFVKAVFLRVANIYEDCYSFLKSEER